MRIPEHLSTPLTIEQVTFARTMLERAQIGMCQYNQICQGLGALLVEYQQFIQAADVDTPVEFTPSHDVEEELLTITIPRKHRDNPKTRETWRNQFPEGADNISKKITFALGEMQTTVESILQSCVNLIGSTPKITQVNEELHEALKKFHSNCISYSFTETLVELANLLDKQARCIRPMLFQLKRGFPDQSRNLGIDAHTIVDFSSKGYPDMKARLRIERMLTHQGPRPITP